MKFTMRPAVEGKLYYSVSTPSVFAEIELPADESRWTAADERKYARLAQLAEAHGTYCYCTPYPLG